MGLILVKFLLPAISSGAFFVPGIFAAKKRLFTLAFLYFFTAFFQLFFHLCTTPLLSLLFCLMGKKLLTFFSTYGLVLSLYSTLIQLTRYTDDRKHSAVVCGGLLIGVRIFQENEGPGVYAGPLTTGGLLLAISWGQEIYRSKALYPDKEKWLKIILPSFALGAISLVLLCVFQNSWNYAFVHSIHHLLMSAAITIILRLVEDGEKQEKCCGLSIACCIC
ncbi:protein myomaker-like [Ciona intestinalis]